MTPNTPVQISTSSLSVFMAVFLDASLQNAKFENADGGKEEVSLDRVTC